MWRILIIGCYTFFIHHTLWAQAESDQPQRANPQFIEIDQQAPQKYPLRKSVELPANSVFEFDYRFFTTIQTKKGTQTGYFDIDTKSGTVLTRVDEMDADAFMVKTVNHKIYNYVIADQQKVLMEFHPGQSSFDTYFQNIVNTRTINFNAKKVSDRYLKNPHGGTYTIYEQTIEVSDGFAVLYFTPLGFEVNSSASTDPLSGLGVVYDDQNGSHFLLVAIESEGMSASISRVLHRRNTFNGSAYKKFSEFFPDQIAADDATAVEKHISNMMKDDIATFKKSNNIADLARAGQIYKGGDIEFQIMEMNERWRELNADMNRDYTDEQKRRIEEEKLQVEKAISIYKIHLQQIQSKPSKYWESNPDQFFELKTRQAEEIQVIMQ